MKIGIISDTHDNAERVEKALKIFRDNQVGLLIHCGDMTNMETALLFQNIPTNAVLGNCDMNEQAISSAIAVSGGQFHGLSGQLLIDNLQIAWTHGHDKKLLHHLENLDKWDFVFYGHTHIAHRTAREDDDN